MWKTRFEVSTSHSNGLTRHRNLSSSSRIIHHYYSRSSPTVPRVREDSPSAIVRPSPPTSISNLEILTEEDDEDIPCTNLSDNEQPNLLIRKQNSYQTTLNKYQIVLPTIIESNDQEIMNDDEQNKYNRYDIKLKQQDSFVATNTNYNQVINDDNQIKEDLLNTNKSNQRIEFTLNQRINELLQQKTRTQNKSACSSTDINKQEIYIPHTFKDISDFFESKALEGSIPTKISQQKKTIKAKRSLSVNRDIPSINNNDMKNIEISSSIEKESNHQIKRIKTSHKFPTEFSINDNKISRRSISNISLKKILLKRWFILLLFIIILLIYLSNIFINSFIYLPQQSKELIDLDNKNVIFQYGQFVRNYFFSSVDLLITFIGQLFFRIDKYEYKNNIVYVATSTYELIYDWFVHLI